MKNIKIPIGLLKIFQGMNDLLVHIIGSWPFFPMPRA
jgi:hypothetical protein